MNIYDTLTVANEGLFQSKVTMEDELLVKEDASFNKSISAADASFHRTWIFIVNCS